jgi:hypothetical protein
VAENTPVASNFGQLALEAALKAANPSRRLVVAAIRPHKLALFNKLAIYIEQSRPRASLMSILVTGGARYIGS